MLKALSTRVRLAALAALVLAAPGTTGAQPAVLPRFGTTTTDGRLVVEGLLGQHRLTLEHGSRVRPAGYGGRVLWALGSRSDPERQTLAGRTSVGPFAIVTGREPSSPRVWHVGAHADFRVLSRPLGGRLDPLVSLSVGAFRAEPGHGNLAADERWLVPVGHDAVGRTLRVPAPASRATTRPALAPGIGARLLIAPGFALRGELKNAVLIGDRVTRQLELAGGVSVAM